MNAIPLIGIRQRNVLTLLSLIGRFGCPEHIYTNRGTQFTSVVQLKMCHYLESQAYQSTVYHSQTQRLVEYLNRKAVSYATTQLIGTTLRPMFFMVLKKTVVGSVVEWLKCPAYDQCGLGSKSTRVILLCS